MVSTLKITGGALASLIVIDVGACWWLGWRLTNWWAPATPIVLLTAIALLYSYTGRSARIAKFAGWCLAWVLLSLGGVVLSYLAGLSDRPAHDALLKALDHALGFDWPSWFEYVAARPLAFSVLALAYASMLPQVVASVLVFSWQGRDDDNLRLFLTGFVGTLLTIAVFAAFPAYGPSYGVTPANPLQAPFLQDLQTRNGIAELVALHQGSFTALDLTQLKGLISFPSLHTLMAIVLTRIHYRTRLFLPALVLNGWMVVAIPIVGGHYLVDVLAGACLAVVTLLLVSMRFPQQDRASGVLVSPD